MAFKYEKFTEEDIEYIDTFRFQNPLTGKAYYGYHWFVDREKNMFLIGLGGQGSEMMGWPACYAFVHNKSVVFLETYERAMGNQFVKEGGDVWLRIVSMVVPCNISLSEEELIEEIKNAFIAANTGERWKNNIRLHFEEICEPRYIPSDARTNAQLE